METISEKLRILRNKMGLTQSSVASAIGVERSTYTYYELGKTVPDWGTIKKLANLFRVDYYLLLEDDNKYVFKDYNVRTNMSIENLSAREKNVILSIRSLPPNKQEEIFRLFELLRIKDKNEKN